LATWQLDNGVYIMSGTMWSWILVENTWSWAESLSLTGRLNASAFSVQNLLWNLVFKGLLKTLPIETDSRSDFYIYQYYNSGDLFSLTMLSEWGWLKANFISGSIITGAFIVPWDLTSKLCTKVDQGPSTQVVWWICRADVKSRQARYVIAN
jgi:hypothetical protein